MAGNENEGKSLMVQGRIVWKVGPSLFTARPAIDQQTKLPRMDKTGKQMMQYGFGLAVPKPAQNSPPEAVANFTNLWNAMYEQAFTLYPSRVLPPAFAMKFKDGDKDIDDQGQPYSLREGYVGCIVIACTTSLPIMWVKHENGQNIQINDGVKCGDYVNVQLSIKAHPAAGQAKPGLYLNPNAVQFLGFGKEIINTPTGDQIFGTAAPAIPFGASATPLVPQPGQMLMPQQYQQPAPAMPPQQAPAYYGVVPPALQPQQAPPVQQYQQPMQPAAPVPQQYQQPMQPAMPAQPSYQQPAQPGMPAPGMMPGVPRF